VGRMCERDLIDIIDQQLTFASHIGRLSARCFYQLRQLRVIRRTLTEEAAKTLVHAFIISRIDYCNSVLSDVSKVHLSKLQSVLHAAARLITRKQKYDHISATVRDYLHWLPIEQRIAYKISLITYKSLHNIAPDYLAELCKLVAADIGRSHLRSAARGDLIVPKTKTKTFGPRSFAASGPANWNKLAPDVRDITLSVDQFRRALKHILYVRAYYT